MVGWAKALAPCPPSIRDRCFEWWARFHLRPLSYGGRGRFAHPTHLRIRQHQPRTIALPLGGITNLDYTVLLCTKMDETRAFYRDVMQFPIETDQKNWCSFRVGAAL